MQHFYDKLAELLGEYTLWRMFLFMFVVGFVKAVFDVGKFLFMAARGWDSAAGRLDAAATNCAKRALSKAHHGNGSITLSMGIKAARLVFTGHPPGVHIGPSAEVRIN